ncbi:MAG: hypothetical protein BYD32DRAFT_37420 [Podila humilis]|nr:MAG: hypothetical protein BYD32DRAFT_37420 [Podila humilis]
MRLSDEPQARLSQYGSTLASTSAASHHIISPIIIRSLAIACCSEERRPSFVFTHYACTSLALQSSTERVRVWFSLSIHSKGFSCGISSAKKKKKESKIDDPSASFRFFLTFALHPSPSNLTFSPTLHPARTLSFIYLPIQPSTPHRQTFPPIHAATPSRLFVRVKHTPRNTSSRTRPFGPTLPSSVFSSSVVSPVPFLTLSKQIEFAFSLSSLNLHTSI